MINLHALEGRHKGKWVICKDGTRGRIKSWNEKFIFVVYESPGKNMDQFEKYIAVATNPNDLAFDIDIDSKTLKQIKKQNGEVLTPLVERFLALENWKVQIAPRGYEEFSYAPNTPYVAELVRDLAIEIIKIKKKLEMI